MLLSVGVGLFFNKPGKPGATEAATAGLLATILGACVQNRTEEWEVGEGEEGRGMKGEERKTT